MIKLNNGRIILLNGDCLHEMKRIKPNSIDMVFADLPYGTTSCKWDTPINLVEMWRLFKIIGKPVTPYTFTASQPFTTVLNNSNLAWFKHEWIWLKNKPANIFNAAIGPMKYHENISVFYDQQCVYHPIEELRNPKNIRINPSFLAMKGKIYGDTANTGVGLRRDSKTIYPKSVQPFARVQYSIYPTQKPIELLEYLIKTYTNPGDTVLDPTMGSGTTGVACANLNRRFIGIDKDINAFNIAAQRIEQSLTNAVNASTDH